MLISSEDSTEQLYFSLILQEFYLTFRAEAYKRRLPTLILSATLEAKEEFVQAAYQVRLIAR